ncbi:MAG: trypsin-like peptidase domain-containing protein [Lachnospiraceae bacterium]|nr:trypsin-like peptidase domain-containing protein [Lachnospiraceae bacterium]
MYENNYNNSYNENRDQGVQQNQSLNSRYTVNNTYPNTPYGHQTENYQYSSPYSAGQGQGNETPEKKKKEKKECHGNGYLKKALVCVSLGLFFGICAGLGFFAVSATTGMLEKNTGQPEAVISQDMEENAVDGEEVTVDESEADNIVDGATDIQKTQTVNAVVSDVSNVVSSVMPAVVSISNTYTETMSYFGQAMTNEAVASGSGIIVGKNDTELLIVTNYHVITDADTLSVQFVEGSEAVASVKGMDPEMDLAVIAVPLEEIYNSTLNEIAIATLGDSDSLTVGEPAIAIGNSLGYGQSVTTGVISALDREMELSDGNSGTFIQTDAAINPGNSGGALLNLKGEVIGINSNKIGGSVIEGMGYAIPISAAKPIIADLMLKETKNKVAEEERGFLGISGISVTEEVSSTYGMPEGVYIAQVYEGTAAAAAGLQKGDIIISFDGEDVSSMDELQKLLEYYAKGDTVEMKIMTIGNGGYHSKTVSITLGNKVEQ